MESGKKRSKKSHLSINVAGVLAWSDKMLLALFSSKDGSKITAADVRKHLQEKLDDGWRVIPMVDDGVCKEFDKIFGCPGHYKNPNQ